MYILNENWTLIFYTILLQKKDFRHIQISFRHIWKKFAIGENGEAQLEPWWEFLDNLTYI